MDEKVPDEKEITLAPNEAAFRERLRAMENVQDRRTFAGLLRALSALPRETARAAWETSAGIAGVSLRASREFLRAAPDAARRLNAEDLRAWGEMGKRLAAGNTETAVEFFAHGVADFAYIPPPVRPLVFQVCLRQMALSSSVALATFESTPQITQRITDAEFLQAVYTTAGEIARRSAKHSADFLQATPLMFAALKDFSDDAERAQVTTATTQLAQAFAVRAGGLAADAWNALPAALHGLSSTTALQLLTATEVFLERGGSAALHFLAAGGDVLRLLPTAFPAWQRLAERIAEQGNAGLIAFVRASPAVFQTLRAAAHGKRAPDLPAQVLEVIEQIARVDAEAALAAFRTSAQALRVVGFEQFAGWARRGLAAENNAADKRARRSYYALETRRSHEALRHGGDADGAHGGLALGDVQHTLRLYIEALTGREEIEIAPLSAVPSEARINDGRTIHLPARVAEFSDATDDFRLYKVLAAHAAGQIEFETHARASVELQAAYTSLAELYAAETEDDRAAFAAGGYILDKNKSEAALAPEAQARATAAAQPQLPPDGDYRAVLTLFPHKHLATKLFGTLENGRIDRRLRAQYRGLRRDLDWAQGNLRARRPRILDLPLTVVPFELLFQITLCGGATDDARAAYGQIVSELEGVVSDYLAPAQATVADTLMATSRVYALFQNLTPEQNEASQSELEQTAFDAPAPQDENQTDQTETQAAEADEKKSRPARRRETDARDLFNAWAQEALLSDPDDLQGAEQWLNSEMPEQTLEAGETAFSYDEWDRDLNDHRAGWCRVIEKRTQRGDAMFVADTRARYRGVVASIRHQFQLMKPENLQRAHRELDGEEFDLDAVIDYVIDRRADGHQSERLYTKRLRRRRDVAVSFLLDQSSSTARTIGRHPLQPYTHPGRRIIEIEKEGLVLMSEALEAVGDLYSINGFTSEGRRNVKFYVVKDFDEKYTHDVHERIGGITYQNNTRLGAAIRHAAARLARQEARTRLLIILSDGRPYDHDYGDARYARDDTRAALRQAKIDGITPFCITIDRDSESELKDLYGDVGYTIIDDVLSLPERLPGIYRRLTS